MTLKRRLMREELVRLLDLSRLSTEAVEALVLEMSRAGEAVVPLAKRLHRETEGNPFFLMEMLKALFSEGMITLEAGTWRADFSSISRGELPLPANLSEAVQARISRLGPDTEAAARLSAVLGREFDFEPLDLAWGRGEETTLTALEDLLMRRLIAEGTEAAGRDYVFTRHKIQEVAYAGLPHRRRQFLHGQVGMALEQLLATELGGVAGELAYHFEQARELDPALTDKAVDHLQRAGDQARLAYAHCRPSSMGSW